MRLLVGVVGLFGPAAALTLFAAGRADLVPETLPAVGVSLAVLALRRRFLVLALLLGSSVLVFYAATGVVIRGLGPTYVDAALWDWDARLFGWLFPEGQMLSLIHI